MNCKKSLKHNKREKWYDKLATWIVIACSIVLIILIALNNHTVGYDNFK